MTPSSKNHPTECQRCGGPLTYRGSGPHPKFCSQACRARKHSPGDTVGPCPRCGEPIVYNGVGRIPKYCSNRCAVLVGQQRYQERIKQGEYGICSVTDCDEPASGRHGMCQTHRERVKRNGTTEVLKKGPTRQVGTRRVNAAGYVVVTVGNYSGYARAQQLEHRVVMEQILGRPLVKGEGVHHINGNRQDNRPENLELWVTPQPAGQRPIDLVDWVLATYPDLVRDRQQAMESSA